MSGGRFRAQRPARRAGPAGGAFRSPLTALILVASLLAQLAALPYHCVLAAPHWTALDTAAIVAELKATFGEPATLCVNVDDNGAPISPAGGCDDQCPLCRLFTQMSSLASPASAALPVRLDAGRQMIGSPVKLGFCAACPISANRARAPPLAV